LRENLKYKNHEKFETIFLKPGISTQRDRVATGLLLSTGSFAQNWNEVIKVVASDRSARDIFGSSVSIRGNYAIVEYYAEDEGVSRGNILDATGSLYVFETTAAVGIVENGFDSSLVLYPNPNKGNFSIDPGETYSGIKKTITDVPGRQLQNTICSRTRELNLPFNQPAGVYFVIIETETKKKR